MEKQTNSVDKKRTVEDYEIHSLEKNYLFVYSDKEFQPRRADDYGSGRVPIEAFLKAEIQLGKRKDGAINSVVPLSINFRAPEFVARDTFRGRVFDNRKEIPYGMSGIFAEKYTEADKSGYRIHEALGKGEKNLADKADAEKEQIAMQYITLVETLKKNRVFEAYNNPPHYISAERQDAMADTLNDLTAWLLEDSRRRIEEALDLEEEEKKNLSKEDATQVSHVSFESALQAAAQSEEGQMRMFETSIELQKQTLAAEAEACEKYQEAMDATGFDMHGVSKEDLDWFALGCHDLNGFMDTYSDLLPLLENYTGLKGDKAVNAYIEREMPQLYQDKAFREHRFNQMMVGNTDKAYTAAANLKAQAVTTPEVKAHMATHAEDVRIQMDYLDKVERTMKEHGTALASYYVIQNGDLDFLKGSTVTDYNKLLKEIDKLNKNIELTREAVKAETDPKKKAQLENSLSQRAEILETLNAIRDVHPENSDIKLSRGGMYTLGMVASKDRRMFTMEENKVIDEVNAMAEKGEINISSFDDILRLSNTDLGQQLLPIVQNYRVQYNEAELREMSDVLCKYEFDGQKIVTTDLVKAYSQKLVENPENAMLIPKEINELAKQKCVADLTDPQKLAATIIQMRETVAQLRESKGDEFSLYSDPEYVRLNGALNYLQDTYSHWEKEHGFSTWSELHNGDTVNDREALRKEIRGFMNNHEINGGREEPSTTLLSGIEKLPYTNEQRQEVKDIISGELTKYNMSSDSQRMLLEKLEEANDIRRPIQDADTLRALCVSYSDKNLERLEAMTINDGEHKNVKKLIGDTRYPFISIAAVNPNMSPEKLVDFKAKMEGAYDAAIGAAQGERITKDEKAFLNDVFGVNVDEYKRDKEGLFDILETKTKQYEDKLCKIMQSATPDQIDRIIGKDGREGSICSYEELLRIEKEQAQSSQKNYITEMKKELNPNYDISAFADITVQKMDQVPECSFQSSRVDWLRREASAFLREELARATIEKDMDRQDTIQEALDKIEEKARAFDPEIMSNEEIDAIKGQILSFQNDNDFDIVENISKTLTDNPRDSAAAAEFNTQMRRFIQNITERGDALDIDPTTYVDIGAKAYNIGSMDITGDVDKMSEAEKDAAVVNITYFMDYLDEISKADVSEATRENIDSTREKLGTSLLQLNPEEAYNRGIEEGVKVENESTFEVDGNQGKDGPAKEAEDLDK